MPPDRITPIGPRWAGLFRSNAARATAPDEVRGTAIEHGESRRLGKGDVIIVPSGTPHWFKEVDGPVLYYVVKVR